MSFLNPLGTIDSTALTITSFASCAQDKDQSRRAKRQRRHAEKSLLRNWQVMYHQADFHTQGQDSTKHSHRSSVYEEELSNRQLWRWMVGKTRTTEASHRLKRGVFWPKACLNNRGAMQLALLFPYKCLVLVLTKPFRV